MLIIGAEDHRLGPRLFSDEINDRYGVECTKTVSIRDWTAKIQI